jgi:acetyl-CoA C-acetyltransferase
MPYTAYIVDACRTAGGRRNGRLSKYHPGDLGATVVDALVKRNNIDPASVDDVIFGCVSQIGAQAGNVARTVVLSSCLPESVPGTSVDRQCGSSQQALHFAAQAVMSGTQDVVIAGGVEVMSLIPIGSNVMDVAEKNRGTPMSEGIKKRYPGVGMFSQFHGAELMASTYGVDSGFMRQMAEDSHANGTTATRNGYFKNEIIPIPGWDKKTGQTVIHDKDEGIRTGTTKEKLEKLRPLNKGGVITAGLASQICDGAAALLIVNENGLRKLGLKPRAKIISLALAGTDPVTMLAGPIPATKKALAQVNMSIGDMDLYEVNEAFASVPAAWVLELKADTNKLNVNGGAMALGHPLGATGAKLMTTLVNELERRGKKYGVQAICEGGGTANATIIEIMNHGSSLRSRL